MLLIASATSLVTPLPLLSGCLLETRVWSGVYGLKMQGVVTKLHLLHAGSLHTVDYFRGFLPQPG